MSVSAREHSTQHNADKPWVLVTGATGYVGGRLVPRLLEAGYHVRAMGRSIDKLAGRPWAKHPNVELIAANVMDANDMRRALTGCWAAYYLVHSMNPQQKDFANADRQGAHNLVEAAEATGVERIFYLSGLGEDSPSLSKHLRSRAEVARILQAGRVPVTVLRAAMIIGSGSASFEILRYLTERLPVMITPRWVATPCQPIAIANVLGYLIGCLSRPETAGQVFDIGGPDVLTYRQLMETYAEEAGLRRRWIIPVPVFTPRLSSYWIHLVTPVPAAIARPLAEGLRNPVVCHESRIRDIIPQELISCREAIRRALALMEQGRVETHWTDAGEIPPAEWAQPGDPAWAGGTLFEDKRRTVLPAPVEEVWQPVVRIGGRTGWYYGDWLWRLRGVLDRLLGGVGLRRGRRDVGHLMPGDTLDFWRVVRVDAPRHLMLAAEMKLPGRAVLEFRLTPTPDGHGTELQQIARFMPGGLMGILYWFAVSPLHHLVFNGMLNGIAHACESQGECSTSPGLPLSRKGKGDFHPSES